MENITAEQLKEMKEDLELQVGLLISGFTAYSGLHVERINTVMQTNPITEKKTLLKVEAEYAPTNPA